MPSGTCRNSMSSGGISALPPNLNPEATDFVKPVASEI
jgi:hypothetical protein